MPTKKVASATKPKRRLRRKETRITQDQIAERAYELWLEGRDGDQLAHWLMAEHELQGRAA